MGKQEGGKRKGKASASGSKKHVGKSFTKGKPTFKKYDDAPKKGPQPKKTNPNEIRLNKYIANSGVW